MDIAELQAFVAVAETFSFSAAAERLHLTQPAVSKRIAALEALLGTRLFDRIGRRITLTEAGRALLPNAHQILYAVDESRRAIANISGQISGPLDIATSHHIGLRRLPPVLREYTRQYPQVRLNIRFTTSEAGCAAVEAGQQEMAIITLPEEHPAKIDTHIIWEDELAVAINKDHSLCRQPADIASLAKNPAVLPETGSYTRAIIERVFTERNLPLDVILETNYLETIMMMASVGLGWSVLPVNMLSPELTVLDIPALRLQRRLGVAVHRERTLSNAATALIEMLQASR